MSSASKRGLPTRISTPNTASIGRCLMRNSELPEKMFLSFIAAGRNWNESEPNDKRSARRIFRTDVREEDERKFSPIGLGSMGNGRRSRPSRHLVGSLRRNQKKSGALGGLSPGPRWSR